MAVTKQKNRLSQREMDEMFSQARDATEMLKVMSHEGRLLILCVLLDGEKSVGEIEESVGLAQATVSQHLSRLRLDRILATRREGRQIYYRIVDNKVTTLISTLYSLFCKKSGK